MKQYFDLTEKIEDNQIKEASKSIQKGGLVLFPTETVYGIGANGLDEEAVKKYLLPREESKIIHLFYMFRIEKW